MALEFRLPDIGEGVVEGEVVRWLIQEGDVLREDQPMVEVMTDKATVEIPTPRAGKVQKLLVSAGKMCAVGQVMIVIETDPDGPKAASTNATATPAVPATNPEPVVSRPANPVDRRVLATPATRQFARGLGVDIRSVLGSGPGGRVTREDVLKATCTQTESPRSPSLPTHIEVPQPTVLQTGISLPAVPRVPTVPQLGVLQPTVSPPVPLQPTPTPQNTEDGHIPFRGVRKKIAENMLRSKLSAAHFTYVEECDVTDLVALRERAQKRAVERGFKLSFLPFVIKAVVSGLKKYPMLNATLDEQREEIILRKSYHIGVAAATETGLIVPVLRDADKRSLFQLAAEIEPLAQRARTGKAAREELTGSTFTITSLGKLGGVLATPIINFPEVAILGVHKIKEKPAVRDGKIEVRQIMNLSISLDHRIVDGYEGAMFLQHVVGLLEDPTLMFMELT